MYPVVVPQASFGYYVWLDHDLKTWELRLQNAERVGENLYLLRIPTNQETQVTTVIHAVQEGEEEEIEPREPIVAPPKYQMPDGKPGGSQSGDTGTTPGNDGCLEMAAKALEGLGPVGKALAEIVRSFRSGSA